MLENTGQKGNSQKMDLSSIHMKAKITPTNVWLTTKSANEKNFTSIELQNCYK